MFLNKLLLILVSAAAVSSGPYQPNWESLDSRPLPAWFDDAKIGVFLNFGIFNVPSFGNEFFWKYWHDGEPSHVAFMKKNYRPDFTYADFAPMYQAEMYQADDWVNLFEKSGIKYVIICAKHHEGFANWPSNRSFNWNSLDVGPKRDIVGEMADAVRKKSDMKFGVYYSWFEWFNPLYIRDVANNLQTNDFITTKSYPDLQELIEKYEPDLLWSDGAWHQLPWYWNSTLFLTWLYNESPVKDKIIVNDRWGIGSYCHHGGYWTCGDRFKPGKLVTHKWEYIFTLDKSSWSLNRLTPSTGYFTIEEMLHDIASTVAFGGNALIGFGATPDGRILPIFQERLLQLGQWLKINGEAIYGTKYCPKFQNDSQIYYTCDKADKFIFATFLRLPENGQIILPSMPQCPKNPPEILGAPGKVTCNKLATGGILLDLSKVYGKIMANSLKWAWTVRMEIDWKWKGKRGKILEKKILVL